jgi:hypothetical protein
MKGGGRKEKRKERRKKGTKEGSKQAIFVQSKSISPDE